MNPLYTNFADCQAQYEHSFFPVIIHEEFSKLKNRYHYVAVVIDEWNQGPDLILKVAQVGSTVIAFVPSIAPLLEGPVLFCKDVKLFTGILKGFKSIDNLLNITFAWKVVVMQISSLTLFVISVLSFAERFELFQVTAIKVMLAAIPILGVLPFGGLLTLSLLGLSGVLLLFAIDKKNKLDLEENHLINHNAAFWSQPLDLQKVEQKQANYESITQELTDEINFYDAILEEGLRLQAGMSGQNTDKNKQYACERAIQELTAIISSKKEDLKNNEEKIADWSLLQKQWSSIDPNELEYFRQAKADKWASKLSRLRFEKKANLFSMASSALLITKQMMTITGVVSKRVNIPLGVHVSLEVIGTVCGLTNFFMKRILQNYKIPPVKLGDYVSFKTDAPESSTPAA